MTADLVRSPTRDCKQGLHRRCVLPDSCGCSCHTNKPARQTFEVVNPPADFGTPSKTGKHRPIVALKWEDPPEPVPRGAGQISALIPELKRNAGRWARVATYRSKGGAATATTRIRGLHPDIEFATRRLPDGTSALYARARVEEEAS